MVKDLTEENIKLENREGGKDWVERWREEISKWERGEIERGVGRSRDVNN